MRKKLLYLCMLLLSAVAFSCTKEETSPTAIEVIENDNSGDNSGDESTNENGQENESTGDESNDSTNSVDDSVSTDNGDTTDDNTNDSTIDNSNDTITGDSTTVDPSEGVDSDVISEWDLSKVDLFTDTFEGEKTYRIYPKDGNNIILKFTPLKDSSLHGSYSTQGFDFHIDGKEEIVKKYSVTSGKYLDITFNFILPSTLTALSEGEQSSGTEGGDNGNENTGIADGIVLDPSLYDSLVDFNVNGSGATFDVIGDLTVAVQPVIFGTDSVYGVYVGINVGRDSWTDGKIKTEIEYSITNDGTNFLTEVISLDGQDYVDFRVAPKTLNGFLFKISVPNKIAIKFQKDQ